MSGYRLEAAAATDTGRVREINEDAWLVHPADRPRLLAVADGMGGHNAGEVASRLCVEELARAFDAGPPGRGLRALFRRGEPDGRQRLADAVRRANKRILVESWADAGRRGMGTTVVAVLFDGATAHLAHVGDSRVYRLRDGTLERLTTDHSLVNEYLRLGVLRPEDVPRFPYKNVIVRAVGLSPALDVDLRTVDVAPGDRYLLCSDGLTDLVDDGRIGERLSTGAEPAATAHALVELALEAGGLDNVTAIVAHCRAEES